MGCDACGKLLPVRGSNGAESSSRSSLLESDSVWLAWLIAIGEELRGPGLGELGLLYALLARRSSLTAASDGSCRLRIAEVRYRLLQPLDVFDEGRNITFTLQRVIAGREDRLEGSPRGVGLEDD